MNMVINIHEHSLHLGAWIFYLAAAIVGAFAGRIHRPNVQDRNSGTLWFCGGLLGICLVAIVHLYPNFWAAVPAAFAVVFAFGLRTEGL